MLMPKVSVILSVFNGGVNLKDSITSVLNQTLNDFEFIIVNDGSTDNSLEIINSFNDPRITVINQVNQGLTKSLNKAIKLSKSNYLARIDADDISMPKRLELQFKYLNSNKDTVLLGTRGIIVEDGNQTISPYYDFSEISKIIRFKNPLIHSSVMIRKSAFEKIGFYDDNFKSSQDYDAWNRLIKIGKIEILNHVLTIRNLLPNSISKRNYFKQSLNSFKIRKSKISLFKNIILFSYQLATNLIPIKFLLFVKNIIPEKLKRVFITIFYN